MTSFNGGGLISRAFLAGSHDPQKYYKKYPKATWIPKGKYEIQATPAEISAVIVHAKPHLKGKRMLCVGTETLGSERFIAENLGILEMDVIGNSLPDNLTSLKETKTVNTGKSPSGTYDLITVFGKANVSKVMSHCKVGTLVVFLGIGAKGGDPELRKTWMAMRKAYLALLQTGGSDFETGVGVIKVLYVNTDVAPVVLKVIEPEVENEEGEAESEPQVSEVHGTSTSVPSTGDAEPLRGNADKPEAVTTPKRRGRQPGSKNKVKA